MMPLPMFDDGDALTWVVAVLLVVALHVMLFVVSVALVAVFGTFGVSGLIAAVAIVGWLVSCVILAKWLIS